MKETDTQSIRRLGFSHPRHPLWSVLRFLILVAGLNFFLWLNVNRFDSHEIKTVLEFSGLIAGSEGLRWWRGRNG